MSSPPSTTNRSEVFLSHASADREMADRLARVLRSNHVPVWYSQNELVGAQQWHDEIGDALERCNWFLLLLSPAAAESFWVKRELLFALRDIRYNEHIIPVVLQPCESRKLSWHLASIQNVDFTVDFEQGCIALFRIWGLVYKPVT